jgi:hypothetical protein
MDRWMDVGVRQALIDRVDKAHLSTVPTPQQCLKYVPH